MTGTFMRSLTSFSFSAVRSMMLSVSITHGPLIRKSVSAPHAMLPTWTILVMGRKGILPPASGRLHLQVEEQLAQQVSFETVTRLDPPHAGRCSGKEQVAGLQRHVAFHMRDKGRHVEDHLAIVPGLHHLPIALQHEIHMAAMWI